ncbi:MAG: hypothetical protein K0R90_451, partial [Oscillospiraceae bacterium]|nr:hypothetical protein [Oscillospiraceae bacterium]
SNGVLIEGEYTEHTRIQPIRHTLNIYVNDKFVKRALFDKSSNNWQRWMYQGERLNLEKGENTITYKVDDNNNGEVQFDYFAVDKL